jgi:hypothetical protein
VDAQICGRRSARRASRSGRDVVGELGRDLRERVGERGGAGESASRILLESAHDDVLESRRDFAIGSS